MIEHTTTIDAPAEHVWTLFTAVENWPDWTTSVTSVAMVEGTGPLTVGTRVRIKQPRMPALIWVVTDLDVGRGWTWVAEATGVTTSARHEIVELGPRSCRVRQVIEQRGVLAGIVGRLTRARTRRYLEIEARGLKQLAESSWDVRAASS